MFSKKKFSTGVLFFFIFIFIITIIKTRDNEIIKKKISSENNSELKLLKIVIPFNVNQTHKVIDSLKIWKKYKPCLENKLLDVNLIFYYSFSSQNFDKEKLQNDIIKNLDEKCFSKIDFVKLQLKNEEDKHVTGARLMFEHMLAKRNIAFEKTQYVFYMEPDTLLVFFFFIFFFNFIDLNFFFN
jgi:hypothetical protein